MTAGKGGIGGAADDSGVEYRRGVAAYAAAHGLAGVPLKGLGLRGESAKVIAVSLETDDPVDDVRIEFAGGTVSYVQAKRTLAKGDPFDGAVGQWVRAAQEGLTPGRDCLVICAASASGPLQTLRQLLRRLKTDEPGDLTAGEQKELNYLKHRLPLEDEQLDAVLKCASIHLLDVEETDGDGAREAALLLRDVVEDPEHAGRAWRDLVGAAGGVARVRGGFRMAGWLNLLRDAGHTIAEAGSAPAAALEAERRATERYVERLRRSASTIDLRPLGASVPPILVEEIDSDVEVRGAERTSAVPLLWPVLRRGRIILTGLPGAGKSTALAQLAADLAELDDRLPLFASLRTIDRLPQARSFRDRLLEVSLRDVPDGDRRLLRNCFTTRLDRGDAVVLLDGLDETYDRRGAVVSEIEEFLAGCSDDAGVVLATRDVAYGQAATLGWPTYRVEPPKSLHRTIAAVLRACRDAATARGEPSVDEAEWVRLRETWVGEAIAANRHLKETPLLPVFLALLAGERDVEQLPTERAAVLERMISSLVRRRAGGAEPLELGTLRGGPACDALFDAFAAEARALIDGNGQRPLDEVRPAVAGDLAERWTLAAGSAGRSAEDAIRFWDEHGIFVATGATQTVAPRVSLFAEVGDALAAVRDSSELEDWVTARAAKGAVEPLVLAASLSADAAEALARVALELGDRTLVHACLQASDEGAVLAAETLQSLATELLADILEGGREGWESLARLLQLPPEVASRSEVIDAVANYSDGHKVIACAAIDLWTRSPEDLRSEPSSLLDALAFDAPPKLAWRVRPAASGADGKVDVRDLAADSLYEDTLVASADCLVGRVDAAADEVIARLEHVSWGTRDRLSLIIKAAGLGGRIAHLPGRFDNLFVGLPDLDPDGHIRVLETIIGLGTPRRLNVAEHSRLDHLADFLETMGLNDASSWGKDLAAHYADVVDLVAVLGAFDLSLLAAQAEVVVERTERFGGHEPFFALFDGASQVPLDNWDAVEDPERAVDFLIEMMRWGSGSAYLAASALWGASIAELAVPRLRDLLPRVSSSTRHLDIAANTLASMAEGPEPQSWLADDDPVLRAVAARWVDPTDEDGCVAPALLALLADEDRIVRAAAVRQIGRSSAADRVDVLTRVADEPEPGWTCLSCRTPNDAGSTSCSKDGCFRAPDHLADEARRFLDGGPDASA